MVRFIAFIAIAIALAFVIETYTEFNVGVTDRLAWFVANGPAWGYAIANNATSVVIGAMFGD